MLVVWKPLFYRYIFILSDYNLFDNNIVLPSPLTGELYPPDMEIVHTPSKKRKAE
jgi:hypothetical protein